MSTIQMKRQGGGAVCNDATAKVPSALSYGEIAVDCFGNIYCGDGKKQIKSQVKNAGNVLFTYKGTLNKDSWSSSGEMYTQTITVSPIDGGPDLTADFILSPPMAQQSENFSTNQITQEALGLVNQGKCIPGKKEVTCKVFSKPTISFDIYWYARVSGGYSSLVDSGQLQNAVDQAAQALSSKLQSMLERTVTPEMPDGLRNIIPEHDEYEDCQYYHLYTIDDYITQQNEAIAKKRIELTKEKKIDLLLASIAEKPYPSVMPDLDMKWVPKYDKEKGFIWEQIEDSEFLGNKDNPLYWKEGMSVNEGYYYTNGDILCRANKSGFPKDLTDENYMEGA